MPNNNSIVPDSIIKEELSLIYKKYHSLKNFRKRINQSYDEVLDNNKALSLILRLLVTCTIGIYTMIIMFALYWNYDL